MQKNKLIINYKLAVEQNQALQQTIITTVYNTRQQKMSTLINSMLQLPVLSQVFVCLLFFLIIYNVIVLKFIFKWWQRFVLNNMQKGKQNANIKKQMQMQKDSRKQCSQNKIQQIAQSETDNISINKLVILLFSSFTLLEPFTINFSANKIYLLFLTNLWIFMLFCTDLFISIQNDISIADKSIDLQQICFNNIFFFLSWNGLVLGFIDIGIRVCSINKIQKQKQKQKMKDQMTTQQKTKIIQVNNQNLQTIKIEQNAQNISNNQSIPYLITLYYILITISSIGLLAYTINRIITSDISQYANFYILSQSRQMIVKFLAGYGFILGLHHAFIIILSMLSIVFCKVRQVQIENISIWLCVLGISQNLKLTKHTQQKTIHNNQQSKQNLAEFTSRNRIQDISYIHNFNPSKNLQQNVLATPHNIQTNTHTNSSSKSHARAKSILFTANQNLFFTMKNNKVQNQQKQFQSGPPIIRIQRRKKRKKKIIYHQNSQQQNTQNKAQTNNQQQPTQQIPQNQSAIAQKKQNNAQRYSASKKLQINTKQLQYYQFDANIVSEPILRNIQNKIYSSSKNKVKCKQLKVIMDTSRDCENFPAVDFIDLSQYAVKDLGYANSIQRKQSHIQLRKRSQNKTFFDQTQNQNQKQKQKKKFSGYYYRKNSHKAPTAPDIKSEAFTFCMQDFSQK